MDKKNQLSVVSENNQWKLLLLLISFGVYLMILIFTFLSMVKHIILNHITAINYRCVYLTQ